MPDFEITDHETGNKLTVTGDTAPTPEESEELFSINSANVIKPKPVAEKPRQVEYADPSNPTQEEWALKEQIDNEQSNLDYSLDILKAIPKGVMQMASTIKSGISEGIDTSISSEGKGRRFKSMLEGGRRSIWDLAELWEVGEGFIGDIGLPEGEQSERRRQRFIQDAIDRETRNAGLIESFRGDTLPALTEAFSILGDPTNILPSGLLGQALKSGAKVAKVAGVSEDIIKNANKVESIIDIPVKLSRAAVRLPIRVGAKVVSYGLDKIQAPIKLIGNTAGAVGDKAGSVRSGIVNIGAKAVGATEEQMKQIQTFSKFAMPFTPGLNAVDKLELGGAATKFTADVAVKKAEQMQNVFQVLSDGKRQARFIEAVIESPNVPRSVKKLASIAGTGGQKSMDMALDAIAGFLSTGALQGILTSIATSDPDAIGQAIGGGGLFGAVGGAASSNSRKGREGGIEASKGIDRLNTEQRERLTRMKLDINNQKAQGDLKFKLNKQDQSTLDMLKGSLSDMRIVLLDPSMYGLHHKKQTGSDANGRPFFEDEQGTLWMDSSHKDITPALVDNYTNRVASDYVSNNPNVVNDIIGDFTSKDGVQLRAQDGSLVNVGGDMGKMVEAYNKEQPSQQHRINNVEQAVQKYLEGNVDRLFTDSNTNLMKGLKDQPATKMALRDTAHIALGKLGLVDRTTGLPLNKDIPKPAQGLSKNKHIARGVSNLNRLNDRIHGNNVRENKIHEAELQKKSDTMERIAREVAEETQARHDKIGEDVAQNEINAQKALQNETLRQAEQFEADLVKDIDKTETKALKATQTQLLKDLKTQDKQAIKSVKSKAQAEARLNKDIEDISEVKAIIDLTVGEKRFKEGTNKTRTPENVAWRARKKKIVERASKNDSSIGEVGSGDANSGTRLGDINKAIGRAKVKEYLNTLEGTINNNQTVDIQGAQPAVKRKGGAEDQSHTVDPVVFRVGKGINRANTLIEVIGLDRGAIIARGLDAESTNTGITQIREAIKEGHNINDIRKDTPEGVNPIIDMMKQDISAEGGSQLKVLKSFDPHNIIKLSVRD